MYKGFLIDLDGVAYLGDKVIPTCREWIAKLNQEKIKYCFVTNNSTRTSQEVYDHLTQMGYDIDICNIITSSEVTANYIKNMNEFGRVYLIGMNGIKKELEDKHISIVQENADYVVIGLDLELTYDKLTTACRELFHGAQLISTNSDLKLSTANGIIPGNGSITQVLELVTGVKAIYMGKPQTEMLEYGLRKLNLKKEEVAVIGDNYLTDILGAINFHMDSIFVETGIMKISDLNQFVKQPTIILKDLSQLNMK